MFKFKSKNRPKLYDSTGTIIKNFEELNIGSGSTLKVAGNISCRAVSGKNYATLYMNAVQLINLVEYGGSPFGEEEGGFEVGQEEDAQETKEEEVNF